MTFYRFQYHSCAITTGCNKIGTDTGCANCYAAVLAERLKEMGDPKYANGFRLTLHPDVLDRPKKWKKPEIVFVNSMSDLFQPAVPASFIKKVFEVMNSLPHLQFQILTKRSGRLKRLAPKLNWTDNIWMGVSVEDARVLNRVEDLKATPAKIKFISAEPLIGSVKGIDLSGIHWCIIGGESGDAHVRRLDPQWVKELIHQCSQDHTRVFVKQMGRHLGQELGMSGIKGNDGTKFPIGF